MKWKMVVVDAELSRRQKAIAGVVIAAGLALGVSTVAMANVKTSFVSGETLTAADLNANFKDLDGRATTLQAATDDLDARLTAVEPAPTSLTVTGSAPENGTAGYTPVVYTHADLVLTPGTWLVQGYAGITIAVNDDGTGLGLFDVTADADVPNSVGPIATLRTSGGLYGLATAQTLITVTSPTTLRLKAIQNGLSVPTFYDFDNPIVAPLKALGPHKLTAVKLR